MIAVSQVETIVKDLLSGSSIRYSEAKTFHGMSIIPLFPPEPVSGNPTYTLFEEALSAGTVVVEEAGEGTVPHLRVRNAGDRPILLMDGEHLVGAKQNRVLNTTILIAAKTLVEIPVSCVEAGRWEMSTRVMDLADVHLFPAARSAKAAAVTRSLRSSGSYASDQHEIWRHVAMKLDEVGVDSPTAAMEEIATHRGADLEEYVSAFPWLAGQTGVLCGIRGRPVCLDLFDHPQTLQKLYPRMIRSYALDALGSESEDALSEDAAREFVASAAEAVVTRHPAVGIGEEIRLTGAGVAGSALLVDGRTMHMALFKSDMPREGSGETIQPPSRRRRSVYGA